jgi:hypothetical protein
MNPLDNSWFPSCVVKLTIRFDESLQISGTGESVTARQIDATTQESRAQQGKRPRRGVHEPTVTIGVARAIANDALAELDETRPEFSAVGLPGNDSPAVTGGDIPGRPGDGVPLTYGTDRFTVIANRVPKRGVFTLPHIRTAATFTLVFDFLEFPVDPRMIRAVGVEIHLGTVSADDYARGMRGDKDPTGRPFSILKTTTDQVDPVTGRAGVNNATLLFYGTADTWSVDLDEGRSTIQIKGRDIRGILIDGKPPPAKISALDLTKPIHEVVQQILRTMGTDADLRMAVAVDTAEWEDGEVPSPGDAEGMTRVRQKAAGGGSSSTPSTGNKTSYWDLITNYCTIVGAMPQIVGSTLWIRPVRRIFDIASKRSTIATPFAGGLARQVGSESIRIRRLVYGRDVKRLSFERKFAGAVVPTIQCISYDDRAAGKQRLIFGQWPTTDTVTAKTKGADEVLRVPMYGVRSVEQLTRIAHGIYEEIGRGETGGQAETRNLATFGGDNTDPDILRLRPTEPIEFVVDATALRSIAPVVSEVNDAARRTFSEEVDVLHRRLGDRLVARALVALARGAVHELLAVYQVSGVEYEWSTGIRTSIAFQNYIVPRHGVMAQEIPKKRIVRTAPVDKAGDHNKAKVTPVSSSSILNARMIEEPAPENHNFGDYDAGNVTGCIKAGPLANCDKPTRPRNLQPTVSVGKARADEDEEFGVP